MRIRTSLAMLALPAAAIAFSGCASSASPVDTAAKQAAATPKAQRASVLISHATAACHDWSVNGGPMKASQTVSLTAGSTLTVKDQDVMAHTVVQTAGQHIVIQNPLTNQTQTATLTFAQPGTYRFATKAGEDYPSAAGVKTTGEDHVLRLTVIVS